MKQQTTWIVTADQRSATLYSCERAAGRGELHIEAVRSTENIHEAEHEHHRATRLSGGERRGSVARSVAHAAPHSVSSGHTAEEEQRRFFREVSEWLNRAAQDTGAKRIVVFAPARLLGLLREHVKDPRTPLDLREGELARLLPAELAAHPAVMNAVGAWKHEETS